jgi:flagellar protein FliS
MMYDGGINFLKHAKDGLESKDIVKFARFLSKGQAIIAELMNTLDFETGGQIAKDLDRLYDFMLFYLTEANLQKDPKKIQRVINLLETIANAYREIIEGGKHDQELQQVLSKNTDETHEAQPTRVEQDKTAEAEQPRISVSL